MSPRSVGTVWSVVRCSLRGYLGPAWSMVHQWVTGSVGCSRHPQVHAPRSGADALGSRPPRRARPQPPSFGHPPRDNLEACAIFKSAARLFATGLGSKPALFGTASAPIRALSGKLAEKPGEYHQKRAEKWRQMALFRGLKRHFAVPAADGGRSKPASMQDFTSVESGCIEPAAAPEIGGRASFFTGAG